MWPHSGTRTAAIGCVHNLTKKAMVLIRSMKWTRHVSRLPSKFHPRSRERNPERNPAMRTSDQIDRNQTFDQSALCDHAVSETHYHIRWHPTGRLDWECFSSVEAAEVRVKEICLKGETATIEQCERSRLRSGPECAPSPTGCVLASASGELCGRRLLWESI